jgi:hypothetical protein
MVAKNDITGDLIKTRGGLSKDGEENFDLIFGKRDVRGRKIDLDEYPENWDEDRIDVIGQNGGTGLHYLNEEGNDNE